MTSRQRVPSLEDSVALHRPYGTDNLYKTDAYTWVGMFRAEATHTEPKRNSSSRTLANTPSRTYDYNGYLACTACFRHPSTATLWPPTLSAAVQRSQNSTVPLFGF